MTLLTPHLNRSAMLRTVTLLSAVSLGLTACNVAPDRNAFDDYPIFALEAADQDTLQIAHSDDLLADMEINAEEVRWVGEHESTDFYAGLVPSETVPGNYAVCFFIAAHELEVAGASCTSDPYDATQPTVTLRVAGTGGAVQAFLVPEDAAIDAVEGWHRASDYVVVVTDPAAPTEISGSLSDGTELNLRR